MYINVSNITLHFLLVTLFGLCCYSSMYPGLPRSSSTGTAVRASVLWRTMHQQPLSPGPPAPVPARGPRCVWAPFTSVGSLPLRGFGDQRTCHGASNVVRQSLRSGATEGFDARGPTQGCTGIPATQWVVGWGAHHIRVLLLCAFFYSSPKCRTPLVPLILLPWRPIMEPSPFFKGECIQR